MSAKRTQRAHADQPIVVLRAAGVELLEGDSGARPWLRFCTGLELVVPGTWHGEVACGQLRQELAPGFVFCAPARELHRVTRVFVPGSWTMLCIETSCLDRHMERRNTRGRPNLRPAVSRMSRELSLRLTRLTLSMRDGAAASELQSSLAEVLDVVLAELGGKPEVGELRRTLRQRVAERLREHLHADPAEKFDLAKIAALHGVNRFEAVRAFRQCYGLPPRAYKLSVRVALAQQALRCGHTPARAALDYGFVDQSHLARHFKRLVGMTPAQYAQMHGTDARKRPPLASTPEPSPAMTSRDVEKAPAAPFAAPSRTRTPGT